MAPIFNEVVCDEFTAFASRAFDYAFDGKTSFTPYEKPSVPDDFQVGVIVGPSGSGKTLLLREFGDELEPEWGRNKAVISHFSSPERGTELLSGVGLNTVPAWLRSYNVLSTGEKFRADLARKLDTTDELVVVDEFTSTVDRNIAKAASRAVRRLLDKKVNKKVIVATCHYDILDWLEPDWVFDTMNGRIQTGRCLWRRPEIQLEVLPCSRQAWVLFAHHHYLTAKIMNNSRCFMAIWDGRLVGFSSSMSMPCSVKNAWREHRTVVLPDFQGMGIGPRLSDAVAQIHINEGKRYYSRTAHPRFGEYRNHSSLWKRTSKYKKQREDIANNEERGKPRFNDYKGDFTRVCYSHEYIG